MSPSPERDEMHLLLGAFVLGGLSPDEHREFTRHLRTCESCQKEAAQLSGLPALLDLADPREVEAQLAAGPPAEPAATLAPIHLLDEVRRRRRRRRWALGAAAAVLVVAGAAIGLGLTPVVDHLGDDSSHVVATSRSGAATVVDIALVSRGWGTQVDLTGNDLPTSGVLYLKVTDLDGRAWDVASWTGTPSGRTTLTTACWVKKGNIKSIEIHTREGATVATASI